MLEGTITFNNISQRSGSILGLDNKTYSFSYDDFNLRELPSPLRGQRVSFIPHGDQARNISFLDHPAAAPAPAKPAAAPAPLLPQPLAQQQAQPAGATSAPAPAEAAPHTHFLNPYNFVRSLDKQRLDNHVLGNCPPPPHDRYVGLSGRITCELANVTPLFISDSHGITEHIDQHRSYRFFEDSEGNKAIPATSLRGMLRSVFEAATNACFGVFGDMRLSYHLDSRKAPRLVPARVEQNDESWTLRLLPGTTSLLVNHGPMGPEEAQYAAWIARYWPLQPSGTLTRQDPPPNARTIAFRERTQRGVKKAWPDIHHGEECYALLERRVHPYNRIVFWDVLELGKDKSLLTRQSKQGQRVEQGWLCITNQNIESKHSERFFFATKSKVIELPSHIRTFYEDLIADYQYLHEKEVQKRQTNKQPWAKPMDQKEPGLSRFVYTTDERQLRGGELVYAMLNGTSEDLHVEFIVPVSVPRVAYEHTIGDLLAYSEQTKHCSDYYSLCPACRAFGWVHENAAELPPETRTAYAGRVKLSHARLEQPVQELGGPGGVTLAILSTPKPTTTQFYLFDSNGRPSGGVDYNNSNARLRGRKFYRHHGTRPSEYFARQFQEHRNEYERVGQKKDDQNRTIRGAVDAGALFSFTLDFENLAPAELGALLWSLELEPEMHHRLGYGKPLGFGSVTVRVKELCVLQPDQRYASLTSANNGWVTVERQRWQDWVVAFKQQMQSCYDKPFEQLENIRDLKHLLSAPANVHIHYPRLYSEPDPEGKNFEWFVRNKRRHGGSLTLDSTESETDLPLDPS